MENVQQARLHGKDCSTSLHHRNALPDVHARPVPKQSAACGNHRHALANEPETACHCALADVVFTIRIECRIAMILLKRIMRNGSVAHRRCVATNHAPVRFLLEGLHAALLHFFIRLAHWTFACREA
jgi:hypothetical protein